MYKKITSVLQVVYFLAVVAWVCAFLNMVIRYDEPSLHFLRTVSVYEFIVIAVAFAHFCVSYYRLSKGK